MPTAAYGREKAYVERVLDAFESRHPDVRVVRFRPGFIFKRSSAAEQRRLFAGPLLPRLLVRPGRLPLVPHPPGLRFQALHSDDDAAAYQLGLHRDVAGAFNIAADPVIDARVLAQVLGGRAVTVPRRLVRGALAGAWHLHLVPADPTLLDLVLELPLLDTTRARSELGWAPRVSASRRSGRCSRGSPEGPANRRRLWRPTAPEDGTRFPRAWANEARDGEGRRDARRGGGRCRAPGWRERRLRAPSGVGGARPSHHGRGGHTRSSGQPRLLSDRSLTAAPAPISSAIRAG